MTKIMKVSYKIINSSIFFILLINSLNYKIYCEPTSPKDVTCHRIECFEKNCHYFIPQINENFNPPKNAIYFIETSCRGGLNSRMACSIESVAVTNLNRFIAVIFVGPLKEEFWKSKTFSKLRSFQNIHFYRINLYGDKNDITYGTPLEDIFWNNVPSRTLYPVGHTADFLKILILNKYGGMYLDLDMIVVKSLDHLPENFIAKQSLNEIASGIIATTKHGIGRKFTEISIADLANNFTITKWGGNSNDVYTRTLTKICKTNSIIKMTAKKCQGFHILSHNEFYPIHWEDWQLYYKPGVKLSVHIDAHTHHTWNGYGAPVKLQQNSYYSRLAQKYCPEIYLLYKERFGQ